MCIRDSGGPACSGVRVAVRVLRLPAPGVRAHVIDGAGGPPAELGIGATWVGIRGCDVSTTTSDDLIGQRPAHCTLERMQHVEDARALAGAEVPGADGPVCRGEPGQGGDMSGREVLHMDVVT